MSERVDFDKAKEHASALLDPADFDAGYDGKETTNLARAYLALAARPASGPDGWEVRTFFEDGKLLDTFSFLDDPVRAARLREYIADGRVRATMMPLYRHTPPATVPDAGEVDA